jgi:thymidylate synthase (FAD)
VELVEHMGSDASICESARVSYDQAGKQGDDRKLIRYLMRHNHTSPFEMAELKFVVRVPLDIWAQWVRHRTASINQYSTRYREAIEAVAIPDWKECRTQSTTNKQGSGEFLPEDIGSHCTVDFADAADACRGAYDRMIARGVAREQARSVLQLANYTQAYWKIDLHNLLHFLHLRMAPEAQQEIREYANAIHQLVFPLFPKTFDAFAHYRLHAMPLTALDIAAIQSSDWAGSMFTNDRERNEYLAKLQRLELPKGE